MARPSSYMPADLDEAIKKGHIFNMELIALDLRGVIIKLPAIYLVVPGRFRDELFDKVLYRITSEYPHNNDEIVLSYDRDPELFKHVKDYLYNTASWVCPSLGLKAKLLEEAEYFGLAGMKAILNKAGIEGVDYHSLYIRIEVYRASGIELPTTLAENLRDILERLGEKPARVEANHGRTAFSTTSQYSAMDRLVIALIQKGYKLFAVNDLPDRSVYHFCT